MNRLLILTIALMLCGCSSFRYYDRLQDCNKLVYRSEVQLRTAVTLIDSLVVVKDSLTMELKQCQQSKILNRKPQTF